MRLTQSLFFIVAAALALAVGAGYAADEHIGKDKSKNDPGFNALDKNHDGYLSRTEAAANPALAKKFKEADKNGDGKLSRAEYLAVKGKKDLNTAKEKVSKALDKDKDTAASGSTKPAK